MAKSLHLRHGGVTVTVGANRRAGRLVGLEVWSVGVEGQYHTVRVDLTPEERRLVAAWLLAWDEAAPEGVAAIAAVGAHPPRHDDDDAHELEVRDVTPGREGGE